MKLRLLMLGLFVLSFQNVFGSFFQVINKSKYELQDAWIDLNNDLGDQLGTSCHNIHLFPGYKPQGVEWKESTETFKVLTTFSCHYKNHFTLHFNNEQHEYYMDKDKTGCGVMNAKEVTVELYDDEVKAKILGISSKDPDHWNNYECSWYLRPSDAAIAAANVATSALSKVAEQAQSASKTSAKKK